MDTLTQRFYYLLQTQIYCCQVIPAIDIMVHRIGRLYGLVVRVPAYRARGPCFDSRRYQISWEVMGLERGPLSLMRIIEERFKEIAAPAYKTEINGRGDPLRSIRKIWH
jgi:hypothetical protein